MLSLAGVCCQPGWCSIYKRAGTTVVTTLPVSVFFPAISTIFQPGKKNWIKKLANIAESQTRIKPFRIWSLVQTAMTARTLASSITIVIQILPWKRKYIIPNQGNFSLESGVSHVGKQQDLISVTFPAVESVEEKMMPTCCRWNIVKTYNNNNTIRSCDICQLEISSSMFCFWKSLLAWLLFDLPACLLACLWVLILAAWVRKLTGSSFSIVPIITIWGVHILDVRQQQYFFGKTNTTESLFVSGWFSIWFW